MTVTRKLTLALIIVLLSGVLANAAMIFYVGRAIEQNNVPLCRLTVKIEDVSQNAPLIKEVQDLNKDYHCHLLVRK
jgi:hypothetical protein